jgi:hypothetical protein
MIGDLGLDGVFVPSLLVWLLVALALNAVVRRLLSALGFYRFVWHRALFDTALFVILLAATMGVATSLGGPNS